MYCDLWMKGGRPLQNNTCGSCRSLTGYYIPRKLHFCSVLKHPLKGSLAFLRYAIKSSKRLFKRTSCKCLENFFIWLKATAGQLIYSLVSLGLMIWIGLLSLASNAIKKEQSGLTIYISSLIQSDSNYIFSYTITYHIFGLLIIPF